MLTAKIQERNKMSCPNFQEQIALYVGGDLLEKESVALEKHLAVCKACEIFMVELQESQISLIKFGQVDLPESAFTRLRASVLSEIKLSEEKISFWKRLFGFAYKWRYSFAASALFISISIPTYFFLASENSKNVQLGNVTQVKESSKEVLSVEAKEMLKETFNETPKNNKQDSSYQEKVTTKNQNKLSKKYLYKPNEKKKVNSFEGNNLDIAKNTNSSTLFDLNDGNSTQVKMEKMEKAGKVEKMEIQTGNPKIRIIWFVNKDVEPFEKRING